MKLNNAAQAEKDEEQVVYGLTKNINSWNPIWANLHMYEARLVFATLSFHWQQVGRM